MAIRGRTVVQKIRPADPIENLRYVVYESEFPDILNSATYIWNGALRCFISFGIDTVGKLQEWLLDNGRDGTNWTLVGLFVGVFGENAVAVSDLFERALSSSKVVKIERLSNTLGIDTLGEFEVDGERTPFVPMVASQGDNEEDEGGETAEEEEPLEESRPSMLDRAIAWIGRTTGGG